jgi:hypothetical protein
MFSRPYTCTCARCKCRNQFETGNCSSRRPWRHGTPPGIPSQNKRPPKQTVSAVRLFRGLLFVEYFFYNYCAGEQTGNDSVFSKGKQKEKRMKPFKRISLFVLVLVLLSACGPKAAGSQGSNPYAPQGDDSALRRDEVKIDSASLSPTVTQPGQVTLDFAYFQPTPCHQLRVEVSKPDAQKRINVSAYAVAEKDKACSLMALATPLKASLNLGSFPPRRHYSVWLNGVEVGEFDSLPT